MKMNQSIDPYNVHSPTSDDEESVLHWMRNTDGGSRSTIEESTKLRSPCSVLETPGVTGNSVSPNKSTNCATIPRTPQRNITLDRGGRMPDLKPPLSSGSRTRPSLSHSRPSSSDRNHSRSHSSSDRSSRRGSKTRSRSSSRRSSTSGSRRSSSSRDRRSSSRSRRESSRDHTHRRRSSRHSESRSRRDNSYSRSDKKHSKEEKRHSRARKSSRSRSESRRHHHRNDGSRQRRSRSSKRPHRNEKRMSETAASIKIQAIARSFLAQRLSTKRKILKAEEDAKKRRLEDQILSVFKQTQSEIKSMQKQFDKKKDKLKRKADRKFLEIQAENEEQERKNQELVEQELQNQQQITELQKEAEELKAAMLELEVQIEETTNEGLKLQQTNDDVKEMFDTLNAFAKKKTAEKRNLQCGHQKLKNELIPKCKNSIAQGKEAGKAETLHKGLCRKQLYRTLHGIQTSDMYDQILYEEIAAMVRECELSLGNEVLDPHEAILMEICCSDDEDETDDDVEILNTSITRDFDTSQMLAFDESRNFGESSRDWSKSNWESSTNWNSGLTWDDDSASWTTFSPK